MKNKLKSIHAAYLLLTLLVLSLPRAVFGLVTCQALICEPPPPWEWEVPGSGDGNSRSFPYAPGKITFVHTDALGTPVASSDDTGQGVWTEHYYPYGEKRDVAAEAESLAIGFTGHRSDDVTGLTYMQGRYYDPIAGRFMGVDPQGFSEDNSFSFNRYAYGSNNPYKYVDPDGESPITAAAMFVARETGIGYGLGVIADSISQYAAFGEVDLQIALTSSAAIAGGEAGLLSGVVRPLLVGGAVAKSVGKSLKDQAADLIPKNANKNRVTLRSPSQKMEVDLAGRTHGNVPTPHTKVSPRNLKAPNQPAFNTKNSPVRPATQQDIRTTRRFLERQGRQ